MSDCPPPGPAWSHVAQRASEGPAPAQFTPAAAPRTPRSEFLLETLRAGHPSAGETPRLVMHPGVAGLDEAVLPHISCLCTKHRLHGDHVFCAGAGGACGLPVGGSHGQRPWEPGPEGGTPGEALSALLPAAVLQRAEHVARKGGQRNGSGWCWMPGLGLQAEDDAEQVCRTPGPRVSPVGHPPVLLVRRLPVTSLTLPWTPWTSRYTETSLPDKAQGQKRETEGGRPHLSEGSKHPVRRQTLGAAVSSQPDLQGHGHTGMHTHAHSHTRAHPSPASAPYPTQFMGGVSSPPSAFFTLSSSARPCCLTWTRESPIHGRENIPRERGPQGGAFPNCISEQLGSRKPMGASGGSRGLECLFQECAC